MDAQGHLRLMESAMEEWRPVVGYEGLYEVSSEGRVRSLPRVVHRRRRGVLGVPGRIMTTFLATNGYQMIHLVKDGKRTPKTIHRIVCRAFNGEQPEGEWICARHLDGDYSNNRAANLAWGTYKQNMLDAKTHGTLKGKVLSDDDVMAIRASKKTVSEIAKEYGLSHQYARCVKTGYHRKVA